LHQIRIKKRNGSLEPIDLSKITSALEHAKGNDNTISISDIEMASNLEFYDGMPSSEIHDILIKTTKNMITPKTLGHSDVASHLFVQKMYL